ncbi:hypothetical protein OGATHE_001466 [Ogataea polymorpha]|uniref:Uncharacterized protein n=1 Tax=Ogataea polymorpha TaxID=460523 RepID=A0A9P8PRL1_9ASCO|nr:hypothetical protein OGATHE_001466 [Ogataea polymorpha]
MSLPASPFLNIYSIGLKSLISTLRASSWNTSDGRDLKIGRPPKNSLTEIELSILPLGIGDGCWMYICEGSNGFIVFITGVAASDVGGRTGPGKGSFSKAVIESLLYFEASSAYKASPSVDVTPTVPLRIQYIALACSPAFTMYSCGKYCTGFRERPRAVKKDFGAFSNNANDLSLLSNSGGIVVMSV